MESYLSVNKSNREFNFRARTKNGNLHLNISEVYKNPILGDAKLICASLLPERKEIMIGRQFVKSYNKSVIIWDDSYIIQRYFSKNNKIIKKEKLGKGFVKEDLERIDWEIKDSDLTI